MIQCRDCEYYRPGADGAPQFTCDPFSTIKEPECLLKWQLAQLNMIAQSHRATLDMYRRFAPLQEKMFKHVEREIDEADEADHWKHVDDEDEDDDRWKHVDDEEDDDRFSL